MAIVANVEKGDWQCMNPDCINHERWPSSFVYGSKVNCPKCGTGKTAQRVGDWNCPNTQCVNHHNCVYSSKAACQRCGTPKPLMGGVPGIVLGFGIPVPNSRPGDWHCANPECKNHTKNIVFSSKTACPICGMAKPVTPQMAHVFPQQHVHVQQVQVQHVQQMPQVQHMQHMPHMPHIQQLPQQVVQQVPQMQMSVPPMEYQAETPLYEQLPFGENLNFTGGLVQRVGGRPSTRPGDWHCADPTCKNFSENVVFANKTHCPVCGKPKPVHSSAMVVGTRPGDWHCPNPVCKNNSQQVVYGSKTACPLCGTQKPEECEFVKRERSRSPRGTNVYRTFVQTL